MSLKAEEFVKTFTKEEILDALFCKKCLNERATRNLTEKFTRIYAAAGKL